ncbi:hypothetical protein G3480_17025 [Thiorhodococcus mannitoliphagus]|uniref:Uncharacterized protein n=1 Tax=Thiorhodococcus mannitoliphagus TaxID=329406 RepID=A0A6P1DZ27_9GAMM|nr:hypothetical protein [Thiorhodococcus mannitoliphagus]NEX21986.1 hypothetical protein [Thiorhodococcus mannitoliphagus]
MSNRTADALFKTRQSVDIDRFEGAMNILPAKSLPCRAPTPRKQDKTPEAAVQKERDKLAEHAAAIGNLEAQRVKITAL